MVSNQLSAQGAETDSVLLADVVSVSHTGYYLMAKRVFDVGFGLLLLCVFAPVWIVAGLLVAISSPGPVLYRQYRNGQHGHPFVCYKFRTMVDDAHFQKWTLLPLNEVTGPVFKLARDPRVTIIGRWLRKTSIDELPQLLNVIRGEMSIVGPRPPLPEEVAQYTGYQLRRLEVKPGLTCLWQVSGRSHIGFDQWVELDIEYIRRRSFRYDLWLILRTIPAVLLAKGAF